MATTLTLPSRADASPADPGRTLVQADTLIARLLPLMAPGASTAEAQHDLREHLATAWFDRLASLQALGRHDDLVTAADALLAQFDTTPPPSPFDAAARGLPLQADCWPWLARAVCDKAQALAALGRVDAALAELQAVQQRFAATDALPTRQWLAHAGLQETRLRAAQGATFARVDMVRQCHELAERYGRDDRPATRAIVGRIRMGRATLLAQLDYGADALQGYDSLHADLCASPDPRLQEVALDALLAKASLLRALGRSGETRAALQTLLQTFESATDAGLRTALARARSQGVDWLVADAGSDGMDGVDGKEGWTAQTEVIAACDALLAAHADSAEPTVRLWLHEAMRHKAAALRERSVYGPGQDGSGDSDADIAAAQAVADAQWTAYEHIDAPREDTARPDHLRVTVAVQHEVLTGALDQLASHDDPVTELAGYDRLLARFGSSQAGALQPLIARALRLQAWAQRASGAPDAALLTLASLQSRHGSSDDAAVQWQLLAGGLERARMLLHAERFDEALQVLGGLQQPATPHHESLRFMDAQVMDLQADVWAGQTPPPHADQKGVDDSGVRIAVETTPAEQQYAAVVEALAKRFAADSDASVRGLVAQSCYQLAVHQRERLHFDAALASYERYAQRFADDRAAAIESTTASALLNQGYLLLMLLDRPADALVVYDAILARFPRATDAGMRDTLARAAASRLTCLNRLQRSGAAVNYGDQYEDLTLATRDALGDTISRAAALGDQDRHRESIALYDEVLAAHVESLHPELRRLCLDAMVRKVYALGRLARREEALALSDELIARYGNELSTSFEKDVALALSYKAVQLDKLARHDEEVAVYDEIVSRWHASDLTSLQKRVASARFGKALTIADTDVEGALALYGQVVSQHLHAPEASLRREAAKSAVNRAYRLRSLGRHDEAARCATALIEACGDEPDSDIAGQVTRARIGLAQSHAALGQTDEQVRVLRSLLDLPDNRITAAQRDTARAELARLAPADTALGRAARALGVWVGKRRA